MTLTDRTIAAIRHTHDHLAGVVAGLTVEQLTAPSGAAGWTVADVLSHLGSGAEINRHTLQGAIGAASEPPATDEVWERWNALPPAEQATALIESSEALTDLLEALTPEQRMGTMVDLGFLPQPVPLATALGMRLNELALHAWDVDVALDPDAQLTEETADLIAEHFASTMAFLLGYTGQGDQVASTRLAVGNHTLVVSEDGIRLAEGVTDPSARFDGPVEAAVRLLSGRLSPDHTPTGTTVSGNVTLDELRAAFPGY